MRLRRQQYGRIGLFLVFSTLLILAACRTPLVHKPTWRLHGIEIGSVDETAATLRINVKITNPNPVAVVVEKITYRLIFNNATLARGEKAGAFAFRPYQEAGISLPVSVDLMTLLAQLPYLRGLEEGVYHVEGEVTMKAFGIRKTFPFTEPATSPVRAAPAERPEAQEGHRRSP